MMLISKTVLPGQEVSDEQVAEAVAACCPAKDYRDHKVLLIYWPGFSP